MVKDLINKAIEARKFSYSPYSGFQVGAALLCKDGTIYTGCNVENASLGATNCAERTAVFKAISEGVRDFVAIAVVAEKGMAWPCAICRQVLNEFKAGDMEVWVGSFDNEWKMKKLKYYLI